MPVSTHENYSTNNFIKYPFFKVKSIDEIIEDNQCVFQCNTSTAIRYSAY
jgi:hypothetical protein